MLTFRQATVDDLPQIVGMLADDDLGATRERPDDPLPAAYGEAFAAIDSDPANQLVVAEADGVLMGVLQLTIIPYLSYQGGRRALIESVRVASESRGLGIGRALVEWAITRAKERGCRMVQFTTDKSREEAKHFYEKLGFRAAHEGMKLHLQRAAIE